MLRCCHKLWLINMACGVASLLVCTGVPTFALGQESTNPKDSAPPPDSDPPAKAAVAAENAPDGTGASAAPKLVPPALLKHVDAEYPEASQQAGESGQVVLGLVIGPAGTVESSTVLSGISEALDGAALSAAQGLLFSPATRDGVPIPARIQYGYTFEFQDVPTEVETPTTGAVSGQVLDADTHTPLVGGTVNLFPETSDSLDASGTAQDAYAIALDAQGRFLFDDLPAGNYQIAIDVSGYVSHEGQETVIASQQTELVYRLNEEASGDSFGATARVAAPAREVTRRTIGKEQLTRIAGTRGDALRAVELMPGVARPPLGAGVLIVRGSAPQDSITMFEGLPVPLLYHFGGLTSFINSRLLEQLDFYPGNFSSRFGRRRGGIVEVKVRDPNSEQWSAVLDANFIDASFLIEGPVLDNLEMAFAARRSHVHVFLDELLPSSVSVVAAPVYYDYQWITTYRPTKQDRLRLMLFGSSDRTQLLFDDSPDALTAGGFDYSTAFHRAHLSYHHKGQDVDTDMDLSVGRINVALGAGQLGVEIKGTEIYGRAEARTRLSSAVHLSTGLDVYAIPGHMKYNGPAPEQSSGNPGATPGSSAPPSSKDQLSASSDFVVVQPALYAELEFDMADTRVVLGSRLDYDNATDSFSYDPRLVGLQRLSDSWTFKVGLGAFGQPPDFPESNRDLGNPNLRQTQTLHTSAGIEFKPDDELSLSLDGFYKRLYDVVVGTPLGDKPFFENGGEGRILGIELSAKVQASKRFFAYLSYTLSRSERSVRGGPYEVFDFDQPHILTVSGNYRLGAGWEAGATWRLVSGNPRTPVIGGSSDLTSGPYVPVYGALNSQRDATFHRLDVRVQKQWEFDGWKLAAYLDLQNAYNSDNPQGQIYNHDYTESQSIQGLPILPSLGMRGEL